MGWGNHKKVTEAHGQTGDWITLRSSGDQIKCVPMNDLVWGPASYTGGKYKPGSWELVSGKIEMGPDDNFRAAVSVYIPDEKKVKALDQTQGLYSALGELSEDHGDIVGCLIKIVRKEKNNWAVSVIKKLDDDQLAKVAAHDLKDLSSGCISWLRDVDVDKLRKANAIDQGGSDGAGVEDDDDIAF